MKRKWIFTLVCTGIVLSACSQNTNDKTKAGLSEHAKKYESMSYEEYRQETGNGKVGRKCCWVWYRLRGKRKGTDLFKRRFLFL